MIINTINKHLFLLSFLCIIAPIFCMEKENKNLEFSLNNPNNRIQLVQTLIDTVPIIEQVFYHENHKSNTLAKYILATKKDKQLNIHGYSLLGFTAIATKLYSSSKDPEYAPYEERKALIKKLQQSGREYDCNFGRESTALQIKREPGLIPTAKDRELALIIEQEAGKARADGKSDLFDE